MNKASLVFMSLSVLLVSGFLLETSRVDRMGHVSQVTGVYSFEMKPITREDGSVVEKNFTVNVVEQIDPNVTGRYHGGLNMTVKSGRSIGEMVETCQHEYIHFLFDFSHPKGDAKFKDPVYRYDHELENQVCDSFEQMLLENEGFISDTGYLFLIGGL